MSAANTSSTSSLSSYVQSHALEIVELAALRGRADDLRTIAARHQITLPPMGRAALSDDLTTLCVRPERWLILSPAARRLRASSLSSECEGVATTVTLSSALTAFNITDNATYAKLAAACRLDLDAQAFPQSHAASTIISQVPVTLARLRKNELLVLTPATTARHFREWLGEIVR